MKKSTIIIGMLLISMIGPFSRAVKAFGGETHAGLTRYTIYNQDGLIVKKYLMQELMIKKYDFPIFFQHSREFLPRLNNYYFDIENRDDMKLESRFYIGIDSEPLRFSSATGWLMTGAVDEDHPLSRAQYHFHDPYLSWEQAGLDNDMYGWVGAIRAGSRMASGPHAQSYNATGMSALLRALFNNITPDYPNRHNVWRSKKMLFTALTGGDDLKFGSLEAESYMALHLISLGATIHLLEDMGVPAHVRNDWTVGHMKVATTGFRVNDNECLEVMDRDSYQLNGITVNVEVKVAEQEASQQCSQHPHHEVADEPVAAAPDNVRRDPPGRQPDYNKPTKCHVSHDFPFL